MIVCDTSWQGHLSLGKEVKAAWSGLYKPENRAEPQWRVLHRIVAVNAFLSVLGGAVNDKCPFCRN